MNFKYIFPLIDDCTHNATEAISLTFNKMASGAGSKKKAAKKGIFEKVGKNELNTEDMICKQDKLKRNVMILSSF